MPPKWTFDAKYYSDASACLDIRMHPVKGKGLFATTSYKEGDAIFREHAFVCAQNLDQIGKVAACDSCLVCLETPRETVFRVCGQKLTSVFDRACERLADEQPPSEFEIVKCPHCDAIYCSEECRDSAWKKYHSLLCVGKMSDASKMAFNRFLSHDWVVDGVDYSDTAFVGLRIVAQGLSLHRFFGNSLEDAFRDSLVLIRAPISDFTFSFLLEDDEECAAKTEEQHWAEFLKYKNCPHNSPLVKAAEASSKCTKTEFLKKGVNDMQDIFSMTEEESCFITTDMWSQTLGAVLLNGQQCSPVSSFFIYQDSLSVASTSAFKAFFRALRKAGINEEALNQCTKGQGIYRTACMFNHSCRPNIRIVPDPDSNSEFIIAECIRNINPGDEMCISYIEEEMSFFKRQQALWEHYLFACGCENCTKEGKMLESV